MSDDFEEELRNIFFQEAAENLEEAEAGYLNFNETMPKEAIDKSFRLAHNLKGSSKAVGFAQVGELLHQMENLLLGLKNNSLPFRPDISTVLLEANDFVKNAISKLKQNTNHQTDISNILEKIKNLQSSPAQATPSPQTAAPPSKEVIHVFNDEPLTPKSISSKKEISQPIPAPSVTEHSTTEHSTTEHSTTEIVALNPESPPPKKTQKKESSEEFIRIPLEKIANLQNYIGEMVILESILKEHLKADTSNTLKNLLRQLDKNTKEVQETVMGLRLIPIKPIFQKLARTIRDTSSQLNKKINTGFIGENIEIDKFILEQISDPLMHMVRNAVDHGIEDPKVREQNNKSEEGTLTIIASHEGGSLVIRIEDDGKGLDPKFLFNKAVSKGLISATKELTTEQCYQLIFASGFSTKSETTDISGRGVGMDVVRTNIEGLNGSIKIESEINKGTKFKITVPLSIGILTAFIVEQSTKKYVIPIHKVKEALSLKNSNIKKIPGVGDAVILRNEEIPLYDLAVGLNLKKNETINDNEKVILIMEESGRKMGIILDKIINIQSVVTKTLGEELRCNSGIIGSVILGDGSAVPILEIPSLIQGEIFSQYIQRTLNKVQI